MKSTKQIYARMKMKSLLIAYFKMNLDSFFGGYRI